MNNLLKQLRNYFDNTQPEIIKKEWEELDIYNKTNVTVNEFYEIINAGIK